MSSFQVADDFKVFGEFCDMDIPEPISTTYNTVYLKFLSNGVHAFSGFRATWTVGKFYIFITFSFYFSPVLSYYKFGNFRENFIFAKNVHRHICHVINSQIGHDLPTSENDSQRVIS